MEIHAWVYILVSLQRIKSTNSRMESYLSEDRKNHEYIYAVIIMSVISAVPIDQVGPGPLVK